MASEQTTSKQVELIIKSQPNWKGQRLKELRAIILATSIAIQEQVKWKMPSKPLGSPTWEAEGILCVADYLKNGVRLTFPKGAQFDDPKSLFNARLDSKTARAIDFAEGQKVSVAALKNLVKQAINANKN